MALKRYESKDADPDLLRQPLRFEFAGKLARNRFMKAAMTERMATYDAANPELRGSPSQELFTLYEKWAKGEYGVIVTGNIMVDTVNLEAAGNLIIPRDAPFDGTRFAQFVELAKRAKSSGSLCLGQVNHPGRQCSTTFQLDPVSASDVQLNNNEIGVSFNKPHPADPVEISEFVEGFAHAASFLQKAGFDGIQLHGAHGYLLAQFFSRTTNKRNDEYGARGTIENRARLLVDIAKEIRNRCGQSFILAIKINSVEWQESGLQPDEAKELCKILERHSFDLVELSGGTYQEFAWKHRRESTIKREAYFIEFADAIVPELSEKMKIYVTGGFKTVGAMVDALATVHGIGLGRPITLEPHLGKDILDGKVKGAIQQVMDQDDYKYTSLVSGSHMVQVSKDQQPIAIDDAQKFQTYMAQCANWMQELMRDEKGEKHGWMEPSSLVS